MKVFEYEHDSQETEFEGWAYVKNVERLKITNVPNRPYEPGGKYWLKAMCFPSLKVVEIYGCGEGFKRGFWPEHDSMPLLLARFLGPLDQTVTSRFTVSRDVDNGQIISKKGKGVIGEWL